MIIPPELYRYDLAQIVDCCRRRGYGNQGQPWTDSALDAVGAPAATLRGIIDTKHGVVKNPIAITDAFGSDFQTSKEWRELISLAYARYQERHALREQKITDLSMQEKAISERTYTHDFFADGTWYYVIANHDGSVFEAAKNASAIVGSFVWSKNVIKDAKNFGCIIENDNLAKIFPNSSWKAYECATGNENIFIQYVSDRLLESSNVDPVVHGIIRASLAREKPLIGGAPLRGNFYDLTTRSADNRGEFYAERVDTSPDKFSEDLSAEDALRLISRLRTQIVGSTNYS